MDAPASRSLPLPLRRIAWAGAVLLALYVAYLAAGNAFLHSDLAHSLVNRKPEKFRMGWSGGHTLWPGRVTLRAVRMSGQVRRTVWSVEADRASARIALWPLLRREARIPWVRAEAVSGSVDRVATELPRPGYRPGGWVLRIDHIRSDSLVGGTLFGWTLTGEGRADIGFSKQFRGGPMELFPSSGTIEHATLARNGAQWLRDAAFETVFSLPRHRSSEYPGADKLRLLEATATLDAETVALCSRLDDAGRYQLDTVPGQGRMEAALALSRGALGEGSRVAVEAPLRQVDVDGSEHDNVFDLRLDVDTDDLRLQARVPEVVGHHVALDADLDLPGRTLPLRGQDWRARLMLATGHARGRFRMPSIGGLLDLFAQADWLKMEGSGTVEADLTLAKGMLAEGSRLRARDVVAHADVLGNRFSGRAHAEAAIQAADDGHAQSRVEIVMDAFRAAPLGAPDQPYVDGNDLRVDLLSEARLDTMQDSMKARMRFTDARIPDLSMFNPYLPSDKLRFAGGSGVLAGDLRVDGRGDVGEGRLRVDGHRVDLSVAGVQLLGDVVLDGKLHRGDLDAGEFELGGTRVEVRNVAFSNGDGDGRDDWWATLEVDGGNVAWKRPSKAGGDLRVRMKDIGFLLALFADRARYPAWVGKVVDAGQARLQGRWQWSDEALILDRMQAANDRFLVDARLKLQERGQDGDLFVKWGVFGVGVELKGRQRKFHLRNAREWYDGRPHLLP